MRRWLRATWNLSSLCSTVIECGRNSYAPRTCEQFQPPIRRHEVQRLVGVRTRGVPDQGPGKPQERRVGLPREKYRRCGKSEPGTSMDLDRRFGGMQPQSGLERNILTPKLVRTIYAWGCHRHNINDSSFKLPGYGSCGTLTAEWCQGTVTIDSMP